MKNESNLFYKTEIFEIELNYKETRLQCSECENIVEPLFIESASPNCSSSFFEEINPEESNIYELAALRKPSLDSQRKTHTLIQIFKNIQLSSIKGKISSIYKRKNEFLFKDILLEIEDSP